MKTYPPDLSAGSFRSSALVEAIKEQADGDVQIDILTSMPNRYSSMACEAHVHAFETLENQGRFDREDFKEKFKRRRIMQKMARDILDLALEPKKEYAAVK